MKLLLLLLGSVIGLVASQTPTMAPTLDVGIIPMYNISDMPVNYTYQPSSIVLAFHNLPHFTKSVTVNHDPVFKSRPLDPGTQTYFAELTGFPILLFCLGFIALVVFQLGVFGYMHWLVPKLGPVPLDASEETTAAIALWTHKVESSRKMWVIYFFLAILLTLLGNHLMFYGDNLFITGYNIFKSSLQNIKGRVDSIEDSCSKIDVAFSSVETSINASSVSCPQASSPDMLAFVEESDQAISEMGFEIELVYEAIEDIEVELTRLLPKYFSFLYSYYAITLSIVICFVACFFTKQSLFMKISIGVAQVIMLLLLIVCTFELIFMMGLGDFCMDPTASVVNAIENNKLASTAKYFGECNPNDSSPKAPGSTNNKLRFALSQAYAARTRLGRSLQYLYAPTQYLSPDIPRVGGPLCGPVYIDTNVQDAFYQLQGLAPQYQNIAEQISCKSLHDIWTLTFEVGLCNRTLIGVFSLYVCQIACTIGIFLTCIAASIMMLYFDEYWDIAANMQDKVKHIGDDDDDGDFAVESDSADGHPNSAGTRSDGYAPVASSSV